MLDGLKLLLAVLFFIGIMVGAYYVKRWFNYTFGYESQVNESVCSMVKPEYLIDPSKCPQ